MACGNQLILFHPIARPAEPPTARMAFRSIIELCCATIRLWLARARERHALSGLDGRLLGDIGVMPGAAEREWCKPFWRGGGRRLRR
jgi:uncharacterized protein YjiS (DUF1127 family)